MNKKEIKKLEKKERNRLDKVWREKLKQEFNNACVICGKTERVNCHHLFPREIKAMRHEPLNGVCLCSSHHKFSNSCSPHKNPIVFLNWYVKNYQDRYVKLYRSYEEYEKTKEST